jgi:thiol-disulfide isomerase/thioredoxin
MQKASLILSLLFTTLHLCAQTRVQVLSDLENTDSVMVLTLSGLTTSPKPYQKTLELEMEQAKVDLYNIVFMGKSGEKIAQVWLDPNVTAQKIWVSPQKDKLAATSIENSPTNALIERVTTETARLKTADQPDSVGIYLLNTILQNPGNTVCVHLAKSFVAASPGDTSGLRKLEQFLSHPENNFDWFFLYKPIMANIRSLLEPKPLRIDAYSFIGLDSIAQKITLAKGTYTVLDFWFLNCPPCRKDHIQIKADLGQLERAGIPLIGINISRHDELSPVNAYLKEHGYQWPNYFQNGSPTITGTLGINGFPTYLVLDDQGVIRYRSHRFQQVKNFLKMP